MVPNLLRERMAKFAMENFHYLQVIKRHNGQSSLSTELVVCRTFLLIKIYYIHQ